MTRNFYPTTDQDLPAISLETLSKRIDRVEQQLLELESQLRTGRPCRCPDDRINL